MLAETEEEIEELDKIKDASLRAGISAEWESGLSFPLPFTKACHFPQQAQFHGLKYIHGLAKAYEDKGGVLLQQCVVGNVNSDEYHTADCSLGKIKAHYIVYATHIPPGVNLLHFRNAPYRSYAAAFRLNSGEYPTGLFYDMKEPYHYFRTQVVNGQEYIIGGGFDHKTGHSLNTEHVFTELEAFLRRYFDIAEIAYHWSSQYFEPADGLPYIGLLPGHNKTYTATGFSGNGMTLGTLAAITISDLITKNESPYAELFAPSRTKPVAGFENFIKENADVISQFVGMRFSYEKIETLAELAPGDAVLADWENRKLALYKDEQGRVHAVDPICPHAGCLVAWNNAEKSWDCPCHGSRFSCNGALLTGPARKGLTPILTDKMEGD
jgi:glycine/D-amino acid oxidase-like deaminating enzyme/nitrite reductase/ring-hydroxylating ferredoxin subunit